MNVWRIGAAVVAGALAWLVCYLFGPVLAGSGIPIVAPLGHGIATLAVPIGFIAALAFLFLRPRGAV